MHRFYSTKQLLLMVALIFLLCFISPHAQGRSLGVVMSVKQETLVEKEHGKLDMEPPDADDLAGMDYTPARKKPPIHN
ncbi:hypothetical protein LINPERPRIM_LOCUS19845 [Linum perenne]